MFQWDTQAAHEALQTMDAAVFVLTADPPVSASERDLLGRVAELAVTTFAVLNKADHLDEAGLAEASEFTRQVLAEAGHPGTVYPMSARAAVRGGDAGFTVFEADFTEYLASRRKSDLRASAVAQARRIASALLDEVMLTRRAAEMRAGDAAGRVEQFSARLAEVAVHSRDAVIIVDGESGRLLFALNDAADQDRPRVCREITEQLDALLNGDLRAAAPAEIERRGRERLAALTVTAAEAWRQRQRQAIEQGLAQVDARLAAGLKAELDVLRHAAAELLGLDLAVPEPGGRLAESPRFFYNTTEDVGQTELLAGVVRRWLPGEFGRRMAREHLRREARGLVDSQIGRARATCSTGSPKPRARWRGWSSSVTPTAPTGYGRPWRRQPACARPPSSRPWRTNGNWPNGKWRCVKPSARWTKQFQLEEHFRDASILCLIPVYVRNYLECSTASPS